MKTKIILSGLVLALAAIGMNTSAIASSNRWADYRAVVESTKGASPTPAPTSTRYTNKYERDQAEKKGLGGTVFPSFEHETGPKYFKNNGIRK